MDENPSRERKSISQGDKEGQRGQEKHRATRAEEGQGKSRGKDQVEPTFTECSPQARHASSRGALLSNVGAPSSMWYFKLG